MADRIKKIKIKQADGSFSDYIPIGAEASNVDLSTGETVEKAIGRLDKTIRYFDNVEAMKASKNLKEGDVVETLGYYKVNDGGANKFLIASKTSNDVPNDGTILSLQNGLIAIMYDINIINVKQMGAKGDYDSQSNIGTDNLKFFNLASSNIADGGTIIIEDGDYLLSNNWIIDVENINICIKPNATIRSQSTTTTGGLIQFLGYYQKTESTSTSPQRNYAHVYGGGYVISTGNNNNTNTIGAVRYKNFIVENINIPTSDRKAITTQYGVSNILIKNCNIGESTQNGISIESCQNIIIDNNIVTCLNNNAININNSENVCIKNNMLLSNNFAVYISNNSKNIKVMNNINNNSRRFITASNIENLYIDNNIINTTEECLNLNAITSNCIISNNTFNSSTANNLFEFNNVNRPSIYNNINESNTHTNIFNFANMNNKQAQLNNNIWSKGEIVGWRPITMNDIVNNNSFIIKNGNRIMYGAGAPLSGTYSKGDIVYNTSIDTGLDIGWINRFDGTPGTWISLGKFV